VNLKDTYILVSKLKKPFVYILKGLKRREENYFIIENEDIFFVKEELLFVAIYRESIHLRFAINNHEYIYN
jgi:hypothetical protein